MARVRTLDGTFLVGRIRLAGWEGEVPDGPELDSAIQHGLVEVLGERAEADVAGGPDAAAATVAPVSAPEVSRKGRKF